jgi:hypothetical protein
VAVLEEVISRAHGVWEEAVAAAEAGRARLRGEVEGALREVAGIREELGDGGGEGEGGDGDAKVGAGRRAGRRVGRAEGEGAPAPWRWREQSPEVRDGHY